MQRLSFVIPLFNEADNLVPLYKEISAVAKKITSRYEIIFVNDGSRDTSQKVIEKLYQKDKRHIKAIQFRNNFGKAAALQAGFQLAQGEIIFTMDADLQDDPREVPRFLKKLDEGFDLVSGWKQDRKDSFVKNTTSKIFNAATNAISKVKLHDFNCGFKAYRNEVAKSVTLYGELHRYIPVIAASQGYAVTEIPVHHRKRLHGKSKYGPIRFIHGFLDLLTVLFITRFRARPLHLFGYLGLTSFTIGFFCGVYLVYVKLIEHRAIGDRPLLLLAVMLMIMGVQISVTGLVGEQIATMVHKNDPSYSIKNILP